MPEFLVHLETSAGVTPNDVPVVFDDLQDAYLDACSAIPDKARDLLIQGRNPMRASWLICNGGGDLLVRVRFDEILPPGERDNPAAGDDDVASSPAQASGSGAGAPTGS